MLRVVVPLALAAMACTPGTDPQTAAGLSPAESDVVYARLRAARAADGKSLPARAAPPQRLLLEAERVAAGDTTPLEGAANASVVESCRFSREIEGFAVTTSDLENMEFPRELLAREELFVSIAVTHAAGAPEFTVLILAIGDNALPETPFGRPSVFGREITERKSFVCPGQSRVSPDFSITVRAM